MFQCYGLILKKSWSDVENETKSGFQRCTTSIQRKCPDIKRMLKRHYVTLIQRYLHDVPVASTLVKRLSKPIGLVTSMNLWIDG